MSLIQNLLKMENQNRMKQIKVGKITLNIGVGEPGNNLDKAVKLLQRITDANPVKTKTMRRIPTFGIRPGLEIGTKVTLRKKKAEQVLAQLLKAVDNNIPERKFDKFGNVSFGIKEYIDIPGIEYDPDMQIIGLEVAVTLTRAGYRIKDRLQKSKIGSSHLITKQEAIDFMKEKFNVHEIKEEQ